MIARIPLLAVLFCSPALADILVLDGANRIQRTHASARAAAIEKLDTDRFAGRASITCALYRPGRSGDPASAATANPAIAELVRRIARQERVDEARFLALVYQESRFNPCARSSAGAIGLAQLMPQTAADLGVNPHDVVQNLRGGARYLAQQLSRFKGNFALALAAYNAGPGAVQRFGGIPPYRETRSYVDNITRNWLPVFGGTERSRLPAHHGAGSAAFEAMRAATIDAMGLSRAVGAGSGEVAAWLEQTGSARTATLKESWQHNSGARNANLDMLNRMIEMATALSDLINARNALQASAISGANRSARPGQDAAGPKEPAVGPCETSKGYGWNAQLEACMRQQGDEHRLLLTAQ